MVRIASAAYPLDWLQDWEAFATKQARWVENAVTQGAELLVFPEYGAMELASLGGAQVAADLEGCLREVAAHKPAVDALHADLAAMHGVHILGGSGPVWTDGPRPANRATLFAPDGSAGHHDKQIMTPYERDPWGLVHGAPLRIHETSLGRIGVLICYDCEFPLLARALADAGAEILLVPSCTDSFAGFTRVRVGAMARALENQCVVAHSTTVGPAAWCPPVDGSRGRAAIYGPPDLGWPETGIFSQTAADAPGWAIADVSRQAIAEVRAHGGVRNHLHWNEQHARLRDTEIARSA